MFIKMFPHYDKKKEQFKLLQISSMQMLFLGERFG